jgi:hypothetical protein
MGMTTIGLVIWCWTYVYAQKGFVSAYAGQDRYYDLTQTPTVKLEGNEPAEGVDAEWRVVAGAMARIHEIAQPKSEFTAALAVRYTLVWVFSYENGREYVDTVHLTFYAPDCRTLKEKFPQTPDGAYFLKPDDAPPFLCYCDMTTDGGGWSLVHGNGAQPGDQKIVSDSLKTGNPFKFESYNLTRKQKAALAARSRELVVVNEKDAWLKVAHPVFDADLLTPQTLKIHKNVSITDKSGKSAKAWVGYANYGHKNGGDFGIADESYGFDNHGKDFLLLNVNCFKQYMYGFGKGYNAGFELGEWKPTAECNAGKLRFRMGLR